MDPERLTTGEWSRWREDDRAWKLLVIEKLDDHGERLARLETIKEQADKAGTDAKHSKWAAVGAILAAILTGMAAILK